MGGGNKPHTSGLRPTSLQPNRKVRGATPKSPIKHKTNYRRTANRCVTLMVAAVPRDPTSTPPTPNNYANCYNNSRSYGKGCGQPDPYRELSCSTLSTLFMVSTRRSAHSQRWRAASDVRATVDCPRALIFDSVPRCSTDLPATCCCCGCCCNRYPLLFLRHGAVSELFRSERARHRSFCIACSRRCRMESSASLTALHPCGP